MLKQSTTGLSLAAIAAFGAVVIAVSRFSYAAGVCDAAADAGRLVYPPATCVRAVFLNPEDR